MNDRKEGGSMTDNSLRTAIRYACDRRFGVLDPAFLCKTLSILEPPSPVCVAGDERMECVVRKFNEHKLGAILIVDESGKLTGILTERDLVRKVIGTAGWENRPVSELMTPDPVAQPPDITIAYALNLMSAGGFRNIPIVDPDGVPIGIVSVKDVVDHIVTSFTEDLLRMDLSEG